MNTSTPSAPELPSPGAPHLFRVEGMTCAGCAAGIQQSLERLPGVEQVTVRLDEGVAIVLGQNLAESDLLARIRGRGFGAEVLEPESDPEARRSDTERRLRANADAWKRRAVIGLACWVPLEILHFTAHGRLVDWILFLGSTLVVAIAGEGFARSALRAARHGTSNMDTLVTLGAGTAYFFSLTGFIMELAGGESPPRYFSESVALLGIISLGHWIEARASVQTGSALRSLLALQPEIARRIEARGERTVATTEIRRGDRLRIRPGDRIPVDGIVITGESDVDEALISGESVPVPRGPGDSVVAGALNLDGALTIATSTDGRDTTVARIARLVERAQTTRAPIQRLADRICAIFGPAVLLIALTTVIAWSLAGDFVTGIISAVTVLIISCPCALGLATPMAVSVGIGAAGRRGLLIREAEIVERLGRARRVIFDKTGTLTLGQPSVVAFDAVAAEGQDAPDAQAQAQLISLAASVESSSEHPFARAIVEFAAERGIALRPVASFRAKPGQGVEGTIDGKSVRIDRDEHASCAVFIDDELRGRFTIRDHIRPDAAALVRALHAMGLSTSMLSGDQADVALQIAREAGIPEEHVLSGETPASKRSRVEAAGDGTIMVGDGINDAAALAAADVGIAMGGGTSTAMESAAVVIRSNRITAVAEVIGIARATMRTVRQNLAFAFLYNGLAIPAAALGLLGVHGPIIAAAAMALSDVTVIGNTLRLRRRLGRKWRESAK